MFQSGHRGRRAPPDLIEALSDRRFAAATQVIRRGGFEGRGSSRRTSKARLCWGRPNSSSPIALSGCRIYGGSGARRSACRSDDRHKSDQHQRTQSFSGSIVVGKERSSWVPIRSKLSFPQEKSSARDQSWTKFHPPPVQSAGSSSNGSVAGCRSQDRSELVLKAASTSVDGQPMALRLIRRLLAAFVLVMAAVAVTATFAPSAAAEPPPPSVSSFSPSDGLSSGGTAVAIGGTSGIFSLGDASFEGSTGGRHLNAPVVGTASNPDMAAN